MSLISVIIPVCPAHNRRDILGNCLESIARQTYPKGNLELVLIGDGCRLRQDLSSVGIRTVVYNFKTRVGATRARNKAIELASGELLAFLDADCVADDSWLEKLSGGFEYDDTGGCGGKTLDPKNRAIYEDRIHGNGYVLPCTGLGNAIFRKKVLKEIGSLDNSLPIYAEEVDLSWRVYLRGYRILYVPEAIVMHKSVPRVRDFFSFGIVTRILTNKYGKTLDISPAGELARLGRKNLIAICGYAFGLLKEIFHAFPPPEKTDLSDIFLQPASSIRPLGINLEGRLLIKPNHIIWWQSENGCKIFDVKRKRHFELDDVAAGMWGSIMQRSPKEKIVESLLDEYEAKSEELIKDFDDFVGNLYKEKVLDLYEFNQPHNPGTPIPQ